MRGCALELQWEPTVPYEHSWVGVVSGCGQRQDERALGAKAGERKFNLMETNSHLTRHTSHVTRHTSHVTCDTYTKPMLHAYTSNMSMVLFPLNPIPFETLSFFVRTALARATQRLNSRMRVQEWNRKRVQFRSHRASILSRIT